MTKPGSRPGKRFSPYIDYMNALVKPEKFYPLDDCGDEDASSGLPRAHNMHVAGSGYYVAAEAADYNHNAMVMGAPPRSSHDFLTDEYVELENNETNGSTKVTVLAWVYVSSLTATRSIFGALVATNRRCQFFIRQTTGELDCILGDGSTEGTSTNDGSAVPVNEVAMIAYTWDGANIRRYLNGTATGTVDAWAGGAIDTGTTVERICAVNGAAGQLYAGKMSMFLFGRNYTLTANEIKALYVCGTSRHQHRRRRRSHL